MARHEWEVISILGYRDNEPVYTDVDTGLEKSNHVMNGQLLVSKQQDRCLITLDIEPRWRGCIQVEGSEEMSQMLNDFILGVLAIVKEENFYRGKTVEFTGRLRFLDIKTKSWENVVLQGDVKRDIRANTIEFLNRSEEWEQYGIPLRRGVLLAGEPGTGKTIICKALMSEAKNITCITTNSYALDADDYLSELYTLAEDLSPSIVFIEDTDLIGQNREEFGYPKGNALLSLLSVLDGVEEKQQVVTVATTNCLEALDKALSQRPSRFDRVIKLTRPDLPQRQELVNRLCGKIPLPQHIQDYISNKAQGCTPAQLQEIVHSLVIEMPEARDSKLEFREIDVDRVLSRINGRHMQTIGFSSVVHGNGCK